MVRRYNSVKRFVARLKACAPERFDVLEYAVGEEAQVDYGEGAPTLDDRGKYRKPYLFAMTLKYSGKSFRKAMWKADRKSWARAHEEAFRAFGGRADRAIVGRDVPVQILSDTRAGNPFPASPPATPSRSPVDRRDSNIMPVSASRDGDCLSRSNERVRSLFRMAWRSRDEDDPRAASGGHAR